MAPSSDTSSGFTAPPLPRAVWSSEELISERKPLLRNTAALGSALDLSTTMELPTVEVRFEDLTIDAEVYVGSRALPTVTNFYRNMYEGYLDKLGLRKSDKRKFVILDGMSGRLVPGRMTLLLGPPGSGKSTLLKVLAGKVTSGKGLKVHGDVTYNGSRFSEFVPQRTAAYVEQFDSHLAALTVRETHEFAARCQGVSHRAEEIRALVRQEKARGMEVDPRLEALLDDKERDGESIVSEYIMTILGLDVCADTPIGNAMFRGVSGGQKKRVTTGEMLVGPQKVMLMDEISTGLDSSTTFTIVKGIRDWVHFRKATVLIALLQPAPETYDLFDDVLLLSEGRIVFQGPREEVVGFYASLGFRCPERKGTSDFLQEVTSKKDQGQYWVRDSPHEYLGVAELAEAFEASPWAQRERAALRAPFDKAAAHPEALVHKKYELSGWEAFKVCFKREWTLLERSVFIYVSKTIQISCLALMAATLFLRVSLRPDSVVSGQLYNGMMFFAIVQLLFNSIGEMTFTIERLPVFYKHRDNLLFPAWSYVLPTTVLHLPISAVIAVLFCGITYYEVGLAPEPSRFFVFLLLMFLVHTLADTTFRALGAVTRNLVIANAQSSYLLLMVLLLGGFQVAKGIIHPWWIWAYWINPLTYIQNAVTVNEFTSPRWQIPSEIPGTTLGIAVLDTRNWPHEYFWVWIGVGVMLAFIVATNALLIWAHAKLEPYEQSTTVVSEETLNERAAAQRSGKARHSGLGHVAVGIDLNTPLLGAADEEDINPESFKVGSGDVVPKEDLKTTESGLLEGINNPAAGRQSIDLATGLARGAPVRHGMVLPFQPLTMTFHDVHYFVDMPPAMLDHGGAGGKVLNGRPQLELLKGISGSFRPGVLTSLMGVSGAGKTTLLDVLAGRKTGGVIQGDVRIDGFPKVQETFARISGYVEQTDVHSPQTTVLEALLFSGMMRFAGDIKKETVHEFVGEVMELVELNSLSGALVGLPGVSGLSVEQRKRLTIAVELVANPSIVFMDEPTSGLDARAAAIVMRTVRNIVNTGRTIVCTIHQPSIDIFEAFDELLLLKRGGETIYCGPLGTRSRHLIAYFEAIPGVTSIPGGTNPAGWMLDVTTPSNEAHLGIDFAERYHSSPLYRRMETLIEQASQPAPGAQPLHFNRQYAQSAYRQYRILVDKFLITSWRTPEYNGIRFLFTVGIGLLFGTALWQLCGRTDTEQDVFNMIGGLYGSTLYLGCMNSIFVQPVISDERMVFYRERAAGMYGVYAWYFALATVETFYMVAQTLLYCGIVYFLCGFIVDVGKFFLFALFMLLTIMYFTFYGVMAVAVTSNLTSAAVLSGSFYGVFNLFSGFIVPQPSIPIWWLWYYYLCPMAWTTYGLVVSQLGDLTDRTIMLVDGTTTTVPEFLYMRFGYSYDFLGYVVLILAGFFLFFWSIGALALRYVNFQKR